MASLIESPKKIWAHAAIYVLDESLKKHAKNLKEFICEVNNCNCSWDKICPDDKGSVAVFHEHYLTCQEQQNFHNQCEVDICDFNDLSKTIDIVKSREVKDIWIPHYKVIIILGHYSALLAGEDDLVVALRKINPIIVAFLGCCGGNTRYGPIAKMSQLLDPDDDKDTKPIIGFYQRRVYVSELLSTSLVIGLRYYMHMSNLQPIGNKATYRKIAIRAFGLSTSKTEIPLPVLSLMYMHVHRAHDIKYSKDPTTFVNDTPEDSFVHNCHKKCNLNDITEIPLSCMQFALCSPMIMEQSLLELEPHRDLSKLHAKIKESMCKRYTELEQLVKNLNEKIKEPSKIKYALDNLCKEKINGYMLHKLIPLIYEINFIKLSNETLDLIKKGDSDSWEKIDHLQFLIAVLRGHWGTNSLAVIKAWATFHLIKSMKDLDPLVKDEESQQKHEYKLCCMCFVLLSDDHFVRFVEPHEQYKHCDIVACTIKKLLPWDMLYGIKDITPKTEMEYLMHMISGKFPDDDELSWADLYQHCQYDDRCVKLLHANQPWGIGNRTVAAHGDMNNQYNYRQIDFKLAAGALSDYVNITVGVPSIRPISYFCKDFINNDDGHHIMNYIDERKFKAEFDCTKELSFVESRVIYKRNQHNITDEQLIQCYQQDSATAHFDEAQLREAFANMHHAEEPKLVSSCRFLFVKFNNPADYTRIEGILFYTDTHYGHNLIDFRDPQIHAIACIQCKNRMEQTQDDHLINTIMKLCMVCKYRMQRKIIEQMTAKPPIRQIDFPFAKIGRLILTYGDDHRLTHIDLRDLP